jgi:hypothetical protein
MESGEIAEALGEAAEVLEHQDVTLESLPVDTPNDIRDQALHPAVVQALNHMEHALAVLLICHATRVI